MSPSILSNSKTSESYEHNNEPLGSIKGLPTKQLLLASQGRLFFMELRYV